MELVLCAKHGARAQEIQNLSLRSSQSGRGEERMDRSLENGVVRKAKYWVGTVGMVSNTKEGFKHDMSLEVHLGV